MKRYRPNYMLMVLDACLFTLSFYFAYWMRFEGNIPARYMSEFKQLLPLQIVCTLVSCFFMRSYNKLWLYADPTDRIAHILGCFIGFGLVMLIVYLFQLPVRSAKIFLLAFLCIAGTTSMSQMCIRDSWNAASTSLACSALSMALTPQTTTIPTALTPSTGLIL